MYLKIQEKLHICNALYKGAGFFSTFAVEVHRYALFRHIACIATGGAGIHKFATLSGAVVCCSGGALCRG